MSIFRIACATAMVSCAVLGSTAPQAQPLPGPAAAATSSSYSTEIATGIRFEVTELRRVPDPGFLQLKFTVTNNSTNDIKLQNYEMAFEGELRHIDLIDFAGRKI